MPAWNDMHYAQCLDLWRVEFDTSQKPSTDGRALCVITGVLYALGGVPSHVKKLQHYPRTHVGHRRSHGLINRRVSERIYTRRAWVYYGSLARENVLSVFEYMRARIIPIGFSAFWIFRMQKRNRARCERLCGNFLISHPFFFSLHIMRTLSNPFICVCARVLRSLHWCWQNSTKRCSNVCWCLTQKR